MQQPIVECLKWVDILIIRVLHIYILLTLPSLGNYNTNFLLSPLFYQASFHPFLSLSHTHTHTLSLSLSFSVLLSEKCYLIFLFGLLHDYSNVFVFSSSFTQNSFCLPCYHFLRPLLSQIFCTNCISIASLQMLWRASSRGILLK